MRGPSDLLRLRKRSDKVKLALLLFLLGALLAWDVLSGAVSYFSAAGEPVEYILTSGTEGAALEGRLQALRQGEQVVCVSRQREYGLSSADKSITITEVSTEYLSSCFGLSTTGSGTEFFLGREAFITFCGAGAQSPAHLTCQTEDGEISGAFRLCDDLPGELALAKGTSVTLSGARTLRVMLDNSDISGLDTAWLEGLGFMIENREVVTEASHRAELLLSRLRYGGLACVLALLLGWQLCSAGRREASQRL